MSWNQYSDDSWMEDNSDQSDQQAKKSQQPSKKQTTQATNQNQGQATKDVQKTANQDNKQHKKQQSKDQQQRVKKNISKKQSRKYPTDSQLIQQFQNNKIQQDKRLKIVFCRQKQQVELLQTLQKQKKIKKLRKFKNKQGSYAITFWNKDNLIKFIKQKIQKNYKFKIQQYVMTEQERKFIDQMKKQRDQKKSKQEEQRAKQRKEHRQNRQHKQHRQHKQYKRQKQQKQFQRQKNKVQYKGKNEQEDRNKQQKKNYRKQRQQINEQKKQKVTKQQKQKDSRQNKQKKKDYQKQKYRGKQQQKKQKHEKKGKQHIKSLHKQKERSNIVSVLNDQADPEDAAKWLEENKLFKQFNAVVLTGHGKYFSYIEKICEICYKKYSYGLTSQINEQAYQQKPQQIFKFIIQADKKPKQRISKIGIYFDKVEQQNFNNIQKYNIHIIGKKGNLAQQVNFDEKQYIELFRKNYQTIVKKWPQWIIFAYGKNIAKLLRLSGIFKKQVLPKNHFKYQIGMQGDLPFAKFQISDLNKTAFKPDTTVINSHLQGL